MSKTQLKESSRRFLYLLKMSILSFVSMGILIGYHGAPLINSLIGVFWFVFAVTAGLVITASLSDDRDRKFEGASVFKLADDELQPFYEKRIDEMRKERLRSRKTFPL